MTAILTPPHAIDGGGSMPGWNIVADMTPPELISARWVAVLRRRIALGLVLVVVLCAAGYAYATFQHRTANDEAEAASARTAELTREASQFAGITRIESTIGGLDGQVATVMKNDVDVARLMARVRRALPRSMSIDSMSVTLSDDGAVDGAVDGSAGLGATGRPTVGTISISGAGRSLDDLPSFVDGLTAVPGFTNVLPTSNQVSDGSAQFSVSVALTDRLYTHHYDLGKHGGS